MKPLPNLFLGVLLLSLALTGCSAKTALPPTMTPSPSPAQPSQTSSAGYNLITPAELESELAHKDFVLVNVHTPFDGKIAQTDFLIPYDEIEQHVNELPADKNAKIVLYCRSGRMSRIAAQSLLGMGYTNVWDLQGGMAAWQVAKYPLEGK